MTLRNFYANTKDTGFTLNFFSDVSTAPKIALLAAPFFTTTEPIEILTKKGCQVSLIVRFSPITTPAALRLAFENPDVKVRYFTDPKFHTKMYIVDDTALVGSANLTVNGLNANRELSILIRRSEHEVFNDLPGIFDELWNSADVLTEDILQQYTAAYEKKERPQNEDAFARFIEKIITQASPNSIKVNSDKFSKERIFIRNFQQKYDEALIPAHDEILKIAKKHGFGRPEYSKQGSKIEMHRFLGWLRREHGAGENWRNAPILSGGKREERIAKYTSAWMEEDSIMKSSVHEAETTNVSNIMNYLSDATVLENLDFDEIFEHLIGCHAFQNRLRFVSKSYGGNLTGLQRLRIEFQENNSVTAVKRSLNYLLSGSGSGIERAYDCIYGGYKLNGFGESCVMELLGWSSKKRPPFNNRTIRGMRFLGYDVEHFVAGT